MKVEESGPKDENHENWIQRERSGFRGRPSSQSSEGRRNKNFSNPKCLKLIFFAPY